MSLVVERYLICNGGDCTVNTASGDKGHPNGFILRIEAKKSGWHSDGTNDYCPKCWAKRGETK